MTNGFAEQLLQEVKEMRAELREVRAVLDIDNEEDSLEYYENPEEILASYEEAKEKYGSPHDA